MDVQCEQVDMVPAFACQANAAFQRKVRSAVPHMPQPISLRHGNLTAQRGMKAGGVEDATSNKGHRY